jgi:hypothetical protein
MRVILDRRSEVPIVLEQHDGSPFGVEDAGHRPASLDLLR